MAEGGGGEDCFKEVFKRFKKKSTDLREVLDLREMKSDFAKCGVERIPSPKSSTEAEMLGLKSPSDWSVLSLPCVSGLLLLPDLFRPGGQYHWVRRCLVDYPCKPNICNLDAHMEREGSGCLWPPNSEDVDTPIHTSSKTKKLKLQPHNVAVSKESLIHKLRWVTLGYHYDWNTKEYSDDHKSPFPTDLAALSRCILHHVGFPGFEAEAAIVNYYHLDSTLSGHTDHSEKDLTKPLLSISFGQSAIFLIGGKTKQVKPVPILLRSGDVLIMSGEARLAYHGVPRILPPKTLGHTPSCLAVEGVCHGPWCSRGGAECSGGVVKGCHEKTDSVYTKCETLVSEWPNFVRYLSDSRININVRQVA